jgi:hypothetical protein
VTFSNRNSPARKCLILVPSRKAKKGFLRPAPTRHMVRTLISCRECGGAGSRHIGCLACRRLVRIVPRPGLAGFSLPSPNLLPEGEEDLPAGHPRYRRLVSPRERGRVKTCRAKIPPMRRTSRQPPRSAPYPGLSAPYGSETAPCRRPTPLSHQGPR